MTARAWLIGIENYPSATGLVSNRLAGTHSSCLALLDWLITSRHIDPTDIWINIDLDNLPDQRPHIRGAQADDLRANLRELVAAARGSTDVLFVFFFGHGFILTDAGSQGQRADILVAADFVSLQDSGNECLRLNDLQNKLQWAIGPGAHFYFVDACRNLCSNEDVEVGVWGKTFKRVVGDPAMFSMYSTRPGAAAATASGFGAQLTDGLHGRGRAKRWDEATLGVFFDSLLTYMRGNVTGQEVFESVARAENGSNLLHVIDPVPTYRCAVVVRGADSTDEFCVTISNGRSDPTRERFSGKRYEFDAQPGAYTVLVDEGPTLLRAASGNGVVDLFEDTEILFVRPGLDEVLSGDGNGPIDPTRPSTVRVCYRGPQAVEVRVQHVAQPEVLAVLDSDEIELPMGPYVVSTFDRSGHAPIETKHVHLEGPDVVDLFDEVSWPVDTVRDRMSALLPIARSGPSWIEVAGVVEPLVDPDPLVWLAIIAAARIIELPGEVSAAVGEASVFADPSANDSLSPVYMLSALDEGSELECRLWPDRSVSRARPVDGEGGVKWVAIGSTPGPKLVTMSVAGMLTRTLVTHAFADRATVITLALRRGELVLGQFSLPIAGRYDRLDGRVRDGLSAVSGQGALNWVRWAAQAQRAFAANSPLSRRNSEFWEMLLYGKWLDPIMSVLAGYELVRAGRSTDLPEAIANLQRYFPGLADVDYLSSIGEDAASPPTIDHPPLVLEGAEGTDLTSYAGMTSARLDPSGPWTMWFAEPNDADQPWPPAS